MSEVINIEDVSLKFPGDWTNRTAMKRISVCLPAEELKYDFVSLIVYYRSMCCWHGGTENDLLLVVWKQSQHGISYGVIS